MVKKAIAVVAMMMLAVNTMGSFIQQQPLDVQKRENRENDVNQEVVETKKEVATNANVATTKPQKSISPYDPIFKAVCGEHGNDWRLMCAMAYHESRFKPDAVSPRGAQGMMQIMPRNAKYFNVELEHLTDVKTNIMVANLLFNDFEKMLKIPDSTPEKDRLSIILACYNGGIGYVFNACGLARRNNENPNSWAVVSKYLKEMKCPEYASKNGVRHFSGVRQTMAYVDNVIEHYDLYRQVAML
ncbi:MAG: transglycosylase SLT domain-containing protein [Rikenellaceae bacterium]